MIDKGKQPSRKIIKGEMNRKFTVEETQMANKNVKRWPTLQEIKEIIIKAKMRHHFLSK